MNKLRMSSVLLVGLLVLAGMTHGMRPALAQGEGACPLPPGVTPPEAPRVTAQQVEEGSASLKDFLVAVRDQYADLTQGTTSLEAVTHFGCLIRQEGSAYRSGSTYLVSLRPDGRVHLHARAMQFSGRLLHPLFLAEVLSSLGVEPAVLADLASPDPATRSRAFAAVRKTLLQQPDGPLPGAEGHAAVYVAANLQAPVVLLAGVDINESHLAPEQTDHGDPAITARDVVDRETLKAFVTQAGEFYISAAQQKNGDILRVKNAMRDPNGPWVHGSVYVSVLDPVSKLILFHGGFPDRFELRRGGIATDIATGELVVDQLLRAANSSPEGGFWQYYFDNPADDADSAEVPKVGYARVFRGEVARADGTVLPLNFIVSSGFYLSSPEVVAERHGAVVESVLPQVMRAMTASTVDAVSGRIRNAGSDTMASGEFSLGAASTVADALLAHGQALESGAFDPIRLLAGSAFVLPLNAADTGTRGPMGSLAVWGSGGYGNFSGGNRQTVDYDGDMVSANLGADAKLGARLLAGMSVAWARATVDYTGSHALTGELTTTLTSVHPYLGWQPSGGMNLWAIAGHGWGEVEIDDESAVQQANDLTQQMVAAGVDGALVESDQMFAGGTTSLWLKAETAFTQADIDGSGTLQSTALEASRHRVALEGEHVQELASGATFTPSLEFGMRRDGGDGETGSGIEFGGGLRYGNPATGFTIEARARTLLSHSGDYEEWGVSGLIRLAPGAGGRGLAFSIRPAWGQDASGVRQLWEVGITGETLPANQATGRMHAEIGYGLATLRGLALVTPYTGMGLTGEGARSWRMGARWQLARDATVSLELSNREAANNDETAHDLILRGAWRW